MEGASACEQISPQNDLAIAINRKTGRVSLACGPPDQQGGGAPAASPAEGLSSQSLEFGMHRSRKCCHCGSRGPTVMKGFAPATCILGALVAVTTATNIPAAAETVTSSCWRMTNDRSYAAGLGPGMDWKILGTCQVTLDANRGVEKIEVIKPSMTLYRDSSDRGGSAVTKPYQNPTGVWAIGIWESPARRSAIFATQTWDN